MKIRFIFFLTLIFIISCRSGPETITTELPEKPAVQDIPVITEEKEIIEIIKPEEPKTAEIIEEVKTVEVIPEPEPVVESEPVIAEEPFDPSLITEQHYTSTMDEVRAFIYELNGIISSGNYLGWIRRISPEYYDEISSEAFLHQVSEQPAMKTRRIILKNAEDYFRNVVMPSRVNSRVDDIEFIGRNRVKAFTITTNRAGQETRLLLYDLEKVNDSWIIIN